jgi:hypothetical protein
MLFLFSFNLWAEVRSQYFSAKAVCKPLTMRHVETIPGMGGEGDKGERWRG